MAKRTFGQPVHWLVQTAMIGAHKNIAAEGRVVPVAVLANEKEIVGEPINLLTDIGKTAAQEITSMCRYVASMARLRQATQSALVYQSRGRWVGDDEDYEKIMQELSHHLESDDLPPEGSTDFVHISHEVFGPPSKRTIYAGRIKRPDGGGVQIGGFFQADEFRMVTDATVAQFLHLTDKTS